MNAVLAFTIIMLVWTISDVISKKTKSLLSSLFVASIIFLIGFKTNLFPEDLLPSSSLLALGGTIVGFIIVHIGTLISIEELRKQWKTVIIGVVAVLGIAISLFIIGPFFKDMNYVIAAIAAISGGTISIVMVQEHVLELGLISVAVLPVLISAFQGLIGFPLTSIILRSEARRLQKEYRDGNLVVDESVASEEKNDSKLPDFLQTTQGTLFVVGLVVLISTFISNVTGGHLNTFIVALLFGVALREAKIFKQGILNGIDAYGLMMLALLIIIFGPLATISVDDLMNLIVPIMVAFGAGVGGNIVFSVVTGKVLGYSIDR